jgi:predicted Zn-dependent protease
VSYENPQVPHEVNVSRESALAEFVRLAIGLCLVVAVLAATTYLLGSSLARLVPFEVEQRLVGGRVVAPIKVAPDDADVAGVRPYLQHLTDRLAQRMDLPQGMRPVVHWSETDVPNAFATLGGHIVVTRGLYRRMPSENALAMVLAHEVAHLRERDPISAVGGSATVALVLVLLGGTTDRFLPHAANAVLVGYSRRTESRADAAAIEAVVAHYGHAGGTAAVFEVLGAYAGAARNVAPTLLSTHPADEERIAQLVQRAKGWDPARQPLHPLEVPVATDR